MATRRQFLGGTVAGAALLRAGHLGAQPRDLTTLSLVEASAAMRRRSLAPVQLTQA